MAYETILTDVDNGILTVTLNRPERLNAWTPQMSADMSKAIGEANANEDIVGIVVTGAGRGFCAGADIEAVFKAQADNPGASRDSARQSGRPADWIDFVRGSKPIVAAINGAAIGVGLTQVLPMDMLIAARGAKLSVRFIKMGLVPELASSHFLALRCGFGAASELMLTGKTISADEALAIRLVDKVVEPGDLLQAAKDAARAMGENPQSALKMVKQLLTQNAAEGDTKLVQQREIAALTQCYTSPEHKEAIAAFLEKREPNFKAARARK
jgi:2-(1,2-epoxy-1,2-dihydrophenyl)acetyl-CoA isomerase